MTTTPARGDVEGTDQSRAREVRFLSETKAEHWTAQSKSLPPPPNGGILDLWDAIQYNADLGEL